MTPIVPRTLDVAVLDGITERSLREHYKLYLGYVGKFNELVEQFTRLQSSHGLTGDLQSIKTDLTFALGAIKNHELYFDTLGTPSELPEGALREAIVANFGNVAQYLVDLKQTALNSRTWAWTTVDVEQGHLFNYAGMEANSVPVWNAVPIVAVDLFGHAYLYDFGENRIAYIEAVLRNLNWSAIARRYEGARALCAAHGGA